MTRKFHVDLSINMVIFAANLLHATHSESVYFDKTLPIFVKQSKETKVH